MIYLSVEKAKELTQKGLRLISIKATDKVHKAIYEAAIEGRSSIETLIPNSAVDTIKKKLEQMGYTVIVGEEGYRYYAEISDFAKTDGRFITIHWD